MSDAPTPVEAAPPPSPLSLRKLLSSYSPHEDQLFLALPSGPDVLPDAPSLAAAAAPPPSNLALAQAAGTASDADAPSQDDFYLSLLQSFPEVLRDALPPGLPPSRPGHDHKIPLIPGSQPPWRAPYRLATTELDELRRQLDDYLGKGWIRPSQSPFAAPVLFVKKASGELRLCVDYRALNAVTQRDRYPLPRVEDCLDRLAGAKVFTKMDLRSGFHQLRVHGDDVAKTSFATRFGSFEWLVCPFGLADLPATFQRLMNEVVGDLLDQGVVVYLDDLLVYAPDRASHDTLVVRLLQRLKAAGLVVHPQKCVWAVHSVEFLGHQVTPEGIHPTRDKLAAIRSFPAPSSLSDLRAFLGITNFLRRYIPSYASLAAPLTDAASRPRLAWSPQDQEAFERLREASLAPSTLALPDPSRPFAVVTDASERATGAVLLQRDLSSPSQAFRPVAFDGHKFTPAESRYTVREREFLAVLHALRVWRHLLMGREVTVYSDHASLANVFSQRDLSPRWARWLERLADYNVQFVYAPGASPLVRAADAISRAPLPDSAAMPVMAVPLLATGHDGLLPDEDPAPLAATSPAEFAVGLSDDPVLGPIADHFADPTAAPLTARLRRMLHHYSRGADGVLRFDGRICVPPRLRDAAFADAHSSPVAAHPGVARTLVRLARAFHWPSLAADVAERVAACQVCAEAKPRFGLPPGHLAPLGVPIAPFQWISMDPVFGLPASASGNDGFLVVVDLFSKFTLAFPMALTASALATAEILWDRVFSVFGVPERLVCDRDTRFTSEVFAAVMRFAGTRLNMATTGHAQTDGQSERHIRTLTTHLRAVACDQGADWELALPAAVLALNTAPHRAHGLSPASLVFGQELRLPASPVVPTPAGSRLESLFASWIATRERLEAYKDHMAQYDAERPRPPPPVVGGMAWLDSRQARWLPSGKLSPKWLGPYRVLAQVGQTSFRLELPNFVRAHPVFHSSVLKAALASHLPRAPNDPLRISAARRHGGGEMRYRCVFQSGPEQWRTAAELTGTRAFAQWRLRQQQPR